MFDFRAAPCLSIMPLLFLAACAQSDDLPPPAEGMAMDTAVVPAPDDSARRGVTVGEDRYVVGPTPDGMGVEIRHAFTNDAASVVYLANCNGAFSVMLERETEGDWVQAYNPPIPACLSTPIEIAPGESHESSLVVPVVDNPDPVAGVDPGTYRLVWGSLHTSWTGSGSAGELIPVERRTSEPFEIARGA